ncbi:hypothetical protein Sjap_025160 [Stephania japonica]|uniref:Uncharacterized protein n=1 Tax=Stephania japonica TaxID=461633 RepID=A0AAP0HFB7_9MAGN
MQRLRSSGSSIFESIALPHLKKKARNSWSAVQDTYLSTKDVFERHKVVFTVSTSIASVATAWFGYSLRHIHQVKVEDRLDSIEKAMKNHHTLEHAEIKKIVSSERMSTEACIATAGTSLVIGYVLGWRGGKWYANRQFRREQLKLLGQAKPRKWQFPSLRRRLLRSKVADGMSKSSEPSQLSTITPSPQVLPVVSKNAPMEVA